MKNKTRKHRRHRHARAEQRPPTAETKGWKLTLEIFDGLLDILFSHGLLVSDPKPPPPALASFHDHSIHVGPIGQASATKPESAFEELQHIIQRYEKSLGEKEKKIKSLENELDFLGPLFASQASPV